MAPTDLAAIGDWGVWLAIGEGVVNNGSDLDCVKLWDRSGPEVAGLLVLMQGGAVECVSAGRGR